MPDSESDSPQQRTLRQARLNALQELADLSQELDLDRRNEHLEGLEEITRINEKWRLYEWQLDEEETEDDTEQP